MKNSLACFKAYDIRGRVPDELNEDAAYRIGRACAEVSCSQRGPVAVGVIREDARPVSGDAGLRSTQGACRTPAESLANA